MKDLCQLGPGGMSQEDHSSYIVPVIFQAAGKQCCMGLKESIVTRFLTHIVLEMGEAFLLNPRRLHREGEKKLVE